MRRGSMAGGAADPLDVSRASVLARVAYATGYLPLSAAFATVKTHAQSVALDVEGYAPVWVGRCFFGASVAVGCLEPVLGAWSDARAEREGPRGRAAILRVAAPVWVLAFGVLWAPGSPDVLKALALAAFFLSHAAVFLNWTALWPTFSHPADRASVALLKQGAQAVGMGVGMAGAPALAGPGWVQRSRLAVFFPCLMAACFFPPILAVDALHLSRVSHSRPSSSEMGDGGFTLRRLGGSALDILSSSPALRLALLAASLNTLAVGCTTNAMPLYARYVLPEAMSSKDASGMTLALVATGMLAVPLWTVVVKRAGPERAWAAGCAVLSAGFALLALAPSYAASMACLGVAGLGTGGLFAAQELAVMAIVDQDAAAHGGRRRDGLVAGLRAVGGHAGNAAQGLVFGAALQYAGFLPGDEHDEAQPTPAVRAIWGLASLAPSACYALCVLCVLGLSRDLAAKRKAE